jgi:hypothetical protein
MLNTRAKFKVVIFAYDLVVGRSLELSLGAGGWHVQLLEAHSDRPPIAAQISGAGALLLGPTVSAKFRRELLSLLEGTPGMEAIPVLRLTYSSHNGSGMGTQDDDDDDDERVTLVAWPCQVEELHWQLEAKMSHTTERCTVSRES